MTKVKKKGNEAMKKIAAILLTFLMLFTMVPMTMAQEAGVIVGDNRLLAPPVGVRSAVSYTLYDTAGTAEQTDAVLSISGNVPAGVTVENNKLVLDGSIIQAGTFTVNLANASYETSQEVSVHDVRIYDDFESLAEGDTVTSKQTLKKLDGTAHTQEIYISETTATIKTEENNKYSDGKIVMRPDWVGTTAGTRYVTFKITAKVKEAWEPIFKIMGGNGAVAAMLYERVLGCGYWTLANDADATGNSVNVWGVPGDDAWGKIIVELDLYKNVYTVWVNDTKICENYKVTQDFSADQLIGRIEANVYADNIALFSGRELEPLPPVAPVTYEVSGDSVLFAPPLDTRSAVSYSLVSSEGENLDGNVSITNAPAGVSLKDNKVVLDGSAISTGKFNVTVTSGDISETKEVTVSDVRIYDNFESFNAGDVIGSTATLKKLDGTDSGIAIYNNATQTVAEENGNKYAKGGIKANLSGISGIDKAQNLTISSKLKFGTDWQWAMSVKEKEGVEIVSVYKGTGANNWTSYINHSGTASSVSSWSTAVPTSAFEKVALEIDLYNNYIVKHKDTVVFTDGDVASGIFKMREIAASNYIASVETGANADDIAVFSGVELAPEAGSITGEAKLYAPPAGEYSEISYNFLNAQGTAVTGDYTMSLEGAPAGVTLSGNKLILNGSTVRAGKFTLNAKNSVTAASKEIEIADLRIYDDYENSNVYTTGDAIGGKSPMLKLDGTQAEGSYYQGSAEVAADGSNHYSKGQIVYRPDWNIASKNTEKAVVSAKIRPVMGDNGSSTVDLYYNNTQGNSHFLQIQLGSDRIWKSNRNKDGETETVVTGKYCEDKWVDLRIELDFANGSYTVYADNEAIFEDYKIADFQMGTHYFNNLITSNDVDNLAVYTGELVKGEFGYDAFEVKVNGETVSDYNNCITAGSTLSVSANVENGNGNGRDLVMIVAEYDVNGGLLQMVSSASVNESILAMSSEKVEKQITVGENIETVKVFIWKQGTLTPLGNSLTLN